MSTEESNESSEIAADEEWKQRVKAEDAALDEQFSTESQSESEPEAAEEQPPETSSEAEPIAASAGVTAQMPPATFLSMIHMYSTQAMVSLGMIPNPISQKAEIQLELARHFIDMLNLLEEKTKGNLDENEETVLTDTLHHLRMAFVEQSKNQSAASE